MKKKAKDITLLGMVRCCKKYGDVRSNYSCEDCPVHKSGCCSYSWDHIPEELLELEVDIPERL